MTDPANHVPSEMPLHHIEWNLEPGSVYAQFSCPAEMGAFCRLRCAEIVCESPTYPCYSDDGDEQRPHELVDQGECHVLLFLDDLLPEESYEGDPTTVRNGPVQVSWHGDHYRWRYAPPRGRRIQLSRQYRLPAGAKSVAASRSKWANPFHPKQRSQEAHALAGERYEEWIRSQPYLSARLEELRGYDLACWCAPHLPCHADVLLKLLDERDAEETC